MPRISPIRLHILTSILLIGLRLDGRRADEVRLTSFSRVIVPGADGAVFLQQGGTHVLASVWGPREVLRPTPEIALALHRVALTRLRSYASRLKSTTAAPWCAVSPLRRELPPAAHRDCWLIIA